MATSTAASRESAARSNGTTTADVEQQLETIRSDIVQLTQQVADLIGQKRDEAMAQVKGQARRAKASVDTAVSDVSEKGQEAIDAVRDVADTLGEAVEDSLRRRPYATLAMVAGVAFLFGAAWRR